MSRSAESEAPTMFSCSRRCIRSSDAPDMSPALRASCVVSRMLLMPSVFLPAICRVVLRP